MTKQTKAMSYATKPDSQHDQAERIKNQIIDAILASPLNVPFIPDTLERDIYLAIFNELEPIVTNKSFWTKVKDILAYVFTCQCCKQMPDKMD